MAITDCQNAELRAKAQIISYLLPTLKAGEIIGCEVFFGKRRARSDLVIVSESCLSAIEIKTQNDDLRRFVAQQKQYRRMFLDVSVFVTPNHLRRVRRMSTNRLGIYTHTPDGVNIIRKARPKRRLLKNAACEWLTVADCRKLLGGGAVLRRLGIQELRRIVENRIESKELNAFVRECIRNRLLSNWERFLEFLGQEVTSEDIRNLTGGDHISL